MQIGKRMKTPTFESDIVGKVNISKLLRNCNEQGMSTGNLAWILKGCVEIDINVVDINVNRLPSSKIEEIYHNEKELRDFEY